jgi:hypothetical protein
MSIPTYVGLSDNSSSSVTGSVTNLTAVSVGDLLVCCILVWGGNTSKVTPSITDTVNAGSWNLPASLNFFGTNNIGGGYYEQQIWGWIRCDTAGTPIINISGMQANAYRMEILQFTNFTTGHPTFVSADSSTNQGSGTSTPATGFNNSVAPEVIVQGTCAYNVGSYSALTGSFTNAYNGTDVCVGYNIPTSTGNAQSFSATITSAPWITMLGGWADVSPIVQSASSPFSLADPWPTSVSVTLSGVTAGNAILVVTPAVINTSGSPTLTITDTVNSVTDLEQLASFGLSSVYSILDFSIIPNASAGAHTLTATVGSGTGNGFIVAAEISGLSSSAALDVFSLNSAGGGSNPSTGNSGTPASVNEIAIAAVSGYYNGSALTIGEPSGYTNIAKYQGGGGYVDYSVDYLTPVALSAQSASWTGLTAVNSYVAGVIVLKAAANQAVVMWWS